LLTVTAGNRATSVPTKINYKTSISYDFVAKFLVRKMAIVRREPAIEELDLNNSSL